jgi:hypothetical protein
VLVFAVTGYGDEKNRRRSREAGFDLHLVKPVAPGSCKVCWRPVLEMREEGR